MTEPEAQVLEARLTRVWKPMEAQMPINTSTEWLFYAVLEPGVTLEVQATGSYLTFLGEGAEEPEVGGLRVATDGVVTTSLFYERDRERVTNLADQWMPAFRRGCWLSGCPTEATAHEKMEWMRGFTEKEIEVWNLKI